MKAQLKRHFSPTSGEGKVGVAVLISLKVQQAVGQACRTVIAKLLGQRIQREFRLSCAILSLEESLKVARIRSFLFPKTASKIVPGYKLKTHKSTKKRFRLSATGKAKHRKAGTSHLAISKPPKKIRQLRGTKVLAPQFERAIQDSLRGNSY
jgi:large subunit ribosomal protein L35